MSTPEDLQRLADAATSSYQDDRYGYGPQGPSLAMGAVFVAIFGLSTLIHLIQIIIARRQWYMIVMLCGGILEILGWAARIWSHYDLSSRDAYIMQICVLVIAPTFYSAALYWAGGLLIQDVAPGRVRFLSPKWFKITFVVADVVSLVIQGIGGGMAGSAEDDDPKQLQDGSHIMLGGIIVQLVIMIFFLFYMLGFAWFARSEMRKSGTRLQVMWAALVVASCAVIIRGGYRTAELNEGFRGELAENERTILLDAIPVAITTVILNIVHPHWFLRLSPALAADRTLSNEYSSGTASGQQHYNGSQITMIQAGRGPSGEKYQSA
ncbi:hypothetical protein JCM8097_000857 [Rhodosporidiobolus ruineniae]